MSDNFDEDCLERIMHELPEEVKQSEIFALFQVILDSYAIEPHDRVELGVELIAQATLTLARQKTAH